MRRVILIVVLATVLVFALATVALAATPTQVYNFYLHNGYMSKSFTAADLRRYLGDAHIHQYGDPHVLARADAAARAALAAMSTTTTAKVTSSSTTTTAPVTSTSGETSTTATAPLTSVSAGSSTTSLGGTTASSAPTATSSAPATTAPATTPANGSSVWWVYVLIGVVAAVLLAGGGYALVKWRAGRKA